MDKAYIIGLGSDSPVATPAASSTNLPQSILLRTCYVKLMSGTPGEAIQLKYPYIW